MMRSLGKALAIGLMLVFSTLLFPSSALAFVPLDGQFTATSDCEALASIRKGTNPGNIQIEAGKVYPLAGKNKDDATHYLLNLTDADPYQRWVAVSCGTVADAPQETADNSDLTPDAAISITSPKGGEYLLAISWQPAFCEIKPDKTECRNLAENPDRPEATNFALHGLWPQPKSNVFCGVSREDISLDKSKRWSELPAIEEELTPETWERLQVIMPGTASYLHRHEWIKHGTCYSETPEEYYAESIALMDAFNNSPVREVVAERIGQQLAIADLDRALEVFGEDTGEKVEVKCSNSVLGELWVNLEGEITLDSSIEDLLRAAPDARDEQFSSCLIDDARD